MARSSPTWVVTNASDIPCDNIPVFPVPKTVITSNTADSGSDIISGAQSVHSFYSAAGINDDSTMDSNASAGITKDGFREMMRMMNSMKSQLEEQQKVNSIKRNGPFILLVASIKT